MMRYWTGFFLNSVLANEFHVKPINWFLLPSAAVVEFEFGESAWWHTIHGGVKKTQGRRCEESVEGRQRVGGGLASPQKALWLASRGPQLAVGCCQNNVIRQMSTSAAHMRHMGLCPQICRAGPSSNPPRVVGGHKAPPLSDRLREADISIDL